MGIKSKIRLAKAQNTVENINNYGILYKVPRKYKVIFTLILANVCIWLTVSGAWNDIISPAQASTGGEIELSVKTGVVETPASQPVSEAIKAPAEVKAKVGASNLGDDGIIAKIQAAFPGDEDMVKIAYAESRFKPDAEHLNNNGTKDCGLFQVNSTWGYDCSWLKNPENNIKVAKIIYATKLGKGNWATYQYAVRHNLPI